MTQMTQRNRTWLRNRLRDTEANPRQSRAEIIKVINGDLAKQIDCERLQTHVHLLSEPKDVRLFRRSPLVYRVLTARVAPPSC